MKSYRVAFVYQNIESGGSTRYRSSYVVEAETSSEAEKKALARLGSNRDGALYHTSVELLSDSEARSHEQARIAWNARNGVGIPCSED